MNHRTEKGFTLLLAVLVSSILLSLGLSIYNIAAKQVLLSSAGRESQFAFYAADTGIECALYWDYQQDAFSAVSPAQVTCAKGTIPSPGGGVAPLTKVPSNGGDTLTTTFLFSLGTLLSDPCAAVTVTKTFSTQKTTVQSLGYSSCVTDNPRRIERAIRAQF